jgi:APA family basic amino acid/polyamine antiporter
MPHTPPRSAGALLRVLGVGFGLAVTLGNTVGSGILRTPGEVAARLPREDLYLLVWVVGGLYALLGALTVSELGAMMPRSGGYYVFARRAFGPWVGFVVGWTDWLASCGALAAAAIAVGEFAGLLWPAVAGRQAAIAAALTVGLSLLQGRGVRWGSGAQTLTSALKGLAFLLVLVAFFVHPRSQPAPVVLPGWSTAAVVIALQAVIYTYDGWYGIIYFGEEVRDPARDVPRSMVGGVLLVMVLYLMVNVALVRVLPPAQLAGQKLAVGAGLEAVLGARGGQAIAALALVSLVSAINAFALMASRVPLALARDGLLPAALARVNAGGTPVAGLLASTVAALLFALTGSFERVVAVMAFFFVANYTVAFLAVFVLRRREPLAPRPYRVWGYPVVPALALMISVLFLVGAVVGDTANTARALLVLAASYPAYRFCRRIVSIEQ